MDLDTSATVACNSMCDGCCRVFDGRSRSRSKRAVSCPEARQVARRRTMRDATQLVCRLIFKPSAHDVAALRLYCSLLGCFSKCILAQTRKRKVHAPRHDRRCHDVATRAGEVCVSAGGEWQGSRQERERVGVEFRVVCPGRTWMEGAIFSTRLHDMTARVVPRHQGT